MQLPKIPFISKKEEKDPTLNELQDHYVHAKRDLLKSLDKLKSKDEIGARLVQYGLAEAVYDKEGNLQEFKGQEKFEKFQHRIVPTEFPEPDNRYRLVLEYPDFNIENTYYWFLRYFNESWGFDKVVKVIDSMASSVASSMFANLQTRLGAQQAQASQYLKGVSDMIKGLFQIVRELRIVDERLQYYYDSEARDPAKLSEKAKKAQKGDYENKLSSEIVLKGLWVDQVEGGAKNPASVYGLAQTIGFTILPDVFFRIKIEDKTKIEKEVEKLKFNAKVKEVLKRKLRQYYEWKFRTKAELEQRRRFLIGYLRQHYDVIKLYMQWVKPYLRNIRRLRLYEKNMENPHIIHAFETQIIELETLFVRSDFEQHMNAVVSLHIFYRVKPDLAYHTHEYQHRGPIYTGLADITLRSYTWPKEKIDKYIAYRNDDDLELMTTIDKSVQEAMHALGDELKKYLKEADPTMIFPDDLKEEEHHHHEKYYGILDPFVSVFRGFGEIFKEMTSIGTKKKEKGHDDHDDHGHGELKGKAKFKHDKAHHRAQHFADEAVWEGYYRYKMGPGANIYWIE